MHPVSDVETASSPHVPAVPKQLIIPAASKANRAPGRPIPLAEAILNAASAKRYREWFEPRTTAENWLGRIGLPLYFFALFAIGWWLNARTAAWTARVGAQSLSSIAGIVRWAALSAFAGFLDAARFAPVGLLAVLALPRRRRPSTRLLFMVVPAVSVGTVLVAVVQYIEAGRGEVPGIFPLLLSFLLCGVGVWVGMNWLRGWAARLFIIPKLIAAALVMAVAAGSFAYLALEARPLSIDSPTLTSETSRRLYRMLRGKNPKTLAPGATATLHASESDLNDLLAWGASISHHAPRARIDLTGKSPAISLSVMAPFSVGDARYINVLAAGAVQVNNGELSLDLRRLSLGSVDVPEFLLAAVSSRVASAVNHSRQLRPFLAPIHALRVRSSGLSASYARADLPPGAIASLFEGPESADELKRAVSAYTSHLLKSSARVAPAERKFGAALETAFRYARERSTEGNAVLENEAAIVALGILLGHSRIDHLAGRVMKVGDWSKAAAFQDATLRKRQDWTKHFFVSAALSVLSTQDAGNLVGRFKEELDADGGSGFSFGDLLADRSGTTFAMVATSDDAAARAIQDRLIRGYHVEDFVPLGADLPENLSDAEFNARFGGVGGPAYRRVAEEIERRLSGCAAYRDRTLSAVGP